MNERIKELAIECYNPYSNFDHEKFAELIVQDIINVLESKNEIRHIASTSFTLSVVEGTIEKSINAITEHYGMKQHHRIKNERTVGRKVSSL
jgi:hypothetical protein